MMLSLAWVLLPVLVRRLMGVVMLLLLLLLLLLVWMLLLLLLVRMLGGLGVNLGLMVLLE